MKILILIIWIAASMQASAQKNIAATDSFMVTGAVKQSQYFSLQSITGFPIVEIDSIVITNHLKERKHAIKNIKGVLLKDILSSITIDQENVRLLSEYYFICIATDNYKTVYSWNEIFNSETGSKVLIITEHDGKKGTSMVDRVSMISANDDATGRRYVKGLQKIIIERAR